MRKLVTSVGPLAAASINAIATTQSGTAGTPLTLTASPYKLDSPRRIIITSAGNDSAVTFTIRGTNWVGMPVSEVLTGASTAAAQSVYDYASILSITPNANTASTVQVGTNGVASTVPLKLDDWGFAPTSVQIDVTGTVSVTLQQTLNDCDVNYTAVNWLNSPDSNAVNASATIQTNYAYVPSWVRLLLNGGTGTATLTVLQAGPTGH